MGIPADLPPRYGGRFFTEGIPTERFPEGGMSAVDAYQLVEEEMALDGDPARNLATFVTTWMELPAKKVSHRQPPSRTSSTTRSTRARPRSSSMIGDVLRVRRDDIEKACETLDKHGESLSENARNRVTRSPGY